MSETIKLTKDDLTASNDFTAKFRSYEIMSEPITIGTDVSQLVGRTIIKAERDPPSGKEWQLYEESLTLTLDDGSVWKFVGEGYDYSRLDIEMTPSPKE